MAFAPVPSGFDHVEEEEGQLLDAMRGAERALCTRTRLLGGGLCVAMCSAALLAYTGAEALLGKSPKDLVGAITGAMVRQYDGLVYDPAGAVPLPEMPVSPVTPALLTLPPMPTVPPLPMLPTLPTLPPLAPMRYAAEPPLTSEQPPAKKEAKHLKRAHAKRPKRDSTKPKEHNGRRGSFLVIGDWGYDEISHGNVNGTGCQKEIGERMKKKMEELGDVKFIINVGDSFYPSGVKSKDDPQWDTKWRNIYDPKVRSVPWYSVYGNHDYHIDPCACATDPKECAQVNWDIDDLDTFYMPGFNWYKEHPEFDLEVVGLDMNKFFSGWNRTALSHELSFGDCEWTHCKAKCVGNAEARATQAFELFAQRFENSKAKNLIVFSHYPTDYFSSVPAFLRNLSTATKHDIVYFGGHRHNTDNTSTWNISPNQNWLVGGGGGWSCDGQQQGFLVASIGADYKVSLSPEFVDYNMCCPPKPNPWA